MWEAPQLTMPGVERRENVSACARRMSVTSCSYEQDVRFAGGYRSNGGSLSHAVVTDLPNGTYAP
jgi:hypothetical protein